MGTHVLIENNYKILWKFVE